MESNQTDFMRGALSFHLAQPLGAEFPCGTPASLNQIIERQRNLIVVALAYLKANQPELATQVLEAAEI